ncbi:hypothetical protein [Acetobacter fallax]|uniref:Uncharacterized protein n=1 Tax=Acetobacter fallax TaxID=1737473 RepID=A0ABX0KC25_9PROT|nr:hypothetical protein [Acetobacter fallax]NHO33338.1 hypothetical protein [Acetobacter fallax]NHO36959.1 hypothetical protein [Acetobacter fallax]
MRIPDYDLLASLTGDETFYVVDENGRSRRAKTGSISGAAAQFASTGKFYSDQGATVARYGDRLFVGSATANDGAADRDNRPTDWLTSEMAATSIGGWAIWRSTLAALSTIGASAVAAGSRTSDAVSNAAALGSMPSSIGVSSWGIADSTQNPTDATAYAFYGEAWRMAGVNYQPTFGMELEAVNLGGDASGMTTPYHVNCGGGVYGIQLGSGGGQTSGTSDAEAALTFVSNPSRWKYGLMFAAGSLTGTDGTDSGYGSAIVMAARQGLSWSTPETVENVQGASTGAMVWSSVAAAANGQRIEFSDNGLLFENSTGHLLFSVLPMADPNATLQVQAGTEQQAAGLYVNEGNNGSPNMLLSCATGGNFMLQGEMVAANTATPFTAAPAYGWLQAGVLVGGSWVQGRIPVFSADQAGG